MSMELMLALPGKQEWVDKIVADPEYWDQECFNDLMVRGAIMEPRR